LSGPNPAQTVGLSQNKSGPQTHQNWARSGLAQLKKTISAGPEPAWPSTGKPTGGNYFPPPILLHAARMFCMQEEKRANKRDKRGQKSVPGAVEAVAVSRLTDSD